MGRGALGFDVSDIGDPLNTASNVERLRSLWLDRTHVRGDDLGPGDFGDFDWGAWHVACHVLGGCGVRQRPEGGLLWLEISHSGRADEYFASVTVAEGRDTRTAPIDSAEGRLLLRGSKLLGFVEGTSRGRTSARSVNDPPDLFNLWRRQDFDQPLGSTEDGGRVWEHWCTLRDIRTTHKIGTSVLTAFIALSAALGDLFIPTIARGRREYGHPLQLRAMVDAGLMARGSALWKGMPTAIPKNCELVFEDADPVTSLRAATTFDWSDGPRYYMFQRKIAAWSKVADVERDLSA